MEEIHRLAQQTDIDASDIKTFVDDLVAEGYEAPGALAVWKSENSNLLRAKKEEVVMRIFSIGKPIQKQYSDQSPHQVIYVNAWMKKVDDDVSATSMKFFSLADENMALVDNMEIDEAYKMDAVLNAQNPDYASYRGGIEPIMDQALPTLYDLAEKNIETIDFENKAGKTIFCQVSVGKHITESPFGLGLEVSAIGSDSITAWLPEDVEILPKVGSTIILYGYVNPKGTINVKRIITK